MDEKWRLFPVKNGSFEGGVQKCPDHNSCTELSRHSSFLQDAANLVSNAKMQSNPENTVGMMALGKEIFQLCMFIRDRVLTCFLCFAAGRNPELLVSPTDDVGKIMSSVHDLKLFGNLSFADGVQVAYLALKHRRNKNGGQRIVLLVGSPVEDDAKKLKKVAGNLKKNNVSFPPDTRF
jgi:26S proteasome regulatory subunit N10